MVTAGVLAIMLVATLPSEPPSAANQHVHYRDNGCDPGWYPVSRSQCCPVGSVPKNGGCYDEEAGRNAAFFTLVLLVVGIIALFASEQSENQDSSEDVPELDDEADDIDPAQLLADLEARAPEHLSEVEKIEWAAREGQRILAEAARKRR